MRSSWVNDAQIRLILGAMMPANSLALRVSDATGLRIDDVLSLHTDTVRRTSRPYVVDSKTGKKHRVYIPAKLSAEMLADAGKIWIFPGRCDDKKHRTRQAVYKDMVKAAAVFRRNGAVGRDKSISPHTMRKRAAVRAYMDGGLSAAAAVLNHSTNDAAVTMLYALSDQQKNAPKARKKRTKGAKNG